MAESLAGCEKNGFRMPETAKLGTWSNVESITYRMSKCRFGCSKEFFHSLLGPPASSHPETSAFRRVSLRELGGTASELPRFHSPAGLPQRLPNNPCAPIEIRGRCLIKCVSIKCVSNVPSCRRTEPSSFRLCVSALTGIKSTPPKMAMADAHRFRGGHAVGYPLTAIAARHGEYGRFRRNHRRRGKPPEREGP